jgi:diguanylate cyclase (GGDEF)-like protein/PAS domain S-box-containing protein
MDEPDAPAPASPGPRAADQRLNKSLAAGLSVLSIGLAALLLSYAGSLSLALKPWSAIALPAGLALAALTRWGPAVLVGAVVGTFIALLGSGMRIGDAAVGALAMGLAAMLAHGLMRRLDFDARLERASDVGVLALGVIVGAALPATLALAAWFPGDAEHSAWEALSVGWVVLGLGMLTTATAVLSFDRGVLHSLQPGTGWAQGWPGLVLAGVPALAALVLLWASPMARSPVGAAAMFLPHVVVAALAMHGRLALGSSFLLLASLLVAGSAAKGLSFWSTGGSLQAAVAAWVGSALALLLLGHAAHVDWRGRAQRWEWALDGSRLGVADWLLDRPDGFASVAWRTLTGHSDGRWSVADWLEQVHAEDRPVLAEAIAAVGAGRVGRRLLGLRQQRGNTWRWLEATLLVVERDAAGRPLRLMATLADVHDKRQAQERQLMSVSLFQHLHEGLLITDPDLRALDVNPAYSQILGVPREEVLGTVPSLLRPTPADPVARQQRAAMWAGLRDHGRWRGELLERRRDGSDCTLQATISTVLGPDEDLRYHVLVISDITEQQQQREQLERQAHFDELTRLPNRARLSELLDDAMRAADRDGYLLVVCYIDLDRFKPVNDRFGHAAGDRLLAELAGRLKSALRSREHWTDSAARLGGDEFVLLLRAGTLEEARLAVERVLRVVSQPYVVDPAQDPVQVTASMGLTVYPIDRSDADTLLRHADHAMYDAKQRGRNGYAFFDAEQRRRTEERALAIGRIQEALDQQELVLHYQPKIDMRSGRVHGFEALLRWDHPERGLLGPAQFLPMIENTGLVSSVGDWVLSQALDHLNSWRRDGFEFSISVNIAPRHLKRAEFVLRLRELLARHSEPLGPFLELEMLESELPHSVDDDTIGLLARCRELGVRIALDDFGMGHSNLNYLKRLPVDMLKIDRSFVHNMLENVRDRGLVEGVINLANIFGCTVVAEGVESPAQARALLDMGCTLGQGIGIAAPMPAAQVAGWIRQYRGMFAIAPAAGKPIIDPGVGRLGR